MYSLTYFLDFHFLRGLFIGICLFQTVPFKLEPSNFGSAHLLWIYYKWYFKFLDFLFYCWVMALFKILCTTIHSKFPLSDLNSDHIVQARIFIFWLKIALLNVLKVLFQFLILYLWLLNNFLNGGDFPRIIVIACWLYVYSKNKRWRWCVGNHRH